MSSTVRFAVLSLIFAAPLCAQPVDPSGLVERSIADLVLLDDEGPEVLGVGERLDHSAAFSGGGGNILSFDDEEEGLYSPFAVETALRRLLGFDALEVDVSAETGALRARTSQGGRQRLEKQLTWLRDVENQRVRVRLAAYRLDAWPSWVRPGAALDAQALAALSTIKPWATLSCRLQDGVRTPQVSLRRERVYLGDYEVNMTGATPTLNPQQSRFREGLWAGLTCSRMPQGPNAVLEFELGVALHEGEERVSYRPGLPLVLPSWSQLDARGSCVVRGKQTVVLAAAQEPRVGGGKVLLITAEVGAIPARLPPPDPAVVLRRYAWGALDRARSNPASTPQTGTAQFHPEDCEELFRNRDEIQDRLPEDVDPDRWTDEAFVSGGPSGLVVCQAGATQDRVAAYLHTNYAKRQTTIAHTVEVSAGAEQLRLSVAACEGRYAGVTWNRLRKLLSAIERSASGSCLVLEDPRDDPIVLAHAHGATLRVRGLANGDGLRVNLDLQRRGLGEGVEIARSEWGDATTPRPGWSWRVQETLQVSAGPVVAAELRAPGGALTKLTLRAQRGGSQ